MSSREQRKLEAILKRIALFEAKEKKVKKNPDEPIDGDDLIKSDEGADEYMPA